MLVKVLAGQKKAATYLYVPADANVDELPDSLLGLLGKLREVLELEVTSERQLARCSGHEVLASISESGYYLQLPPVEFARS